MTYLIEAPLEFEAQLAESQRPSSATKPWLTYWPAEWERLASNAQTEAFGCTINGGQNANENPG